MAEKKYREVFVFAAGMTPQIITETIYALAIRDEPVLPDEIWIITTQQGKKKVIETLSKGGILKEMSSVLLIPEIPLTEDSFVLIRLRP